MRLVSRATWTVSAPMPGLYYVGFPWLCKRKSGIIPGVDEDAARVVGHLARP